MAAAMASVQGRLGLLCFSGACGRRRRLAGRRGGRPGTGGLPPPNHHLSPVDMSRLRSARGPGHQRARATRTAATAPPPCSVRPWAVAAMPGRPERRPDAEPSRSEATRAMDARSGVRVAPQRPASGWSTRDTVSSWTPGGSSRSVGRSRGTERSTSSPAGRSPGRCARPRSGSPPSATRSSSAERRRRTGRRDQGADETGWRTSGRTPSSRSSSRNLPRRRYPPWRR